MQPEQYKATRERLGTQAEVAAMLGAHGIALRCFAVNADGSPKHPLYVRRDAVLIDYPGR